MVSATFAADFTLFNQAIQSAVVSIKGLDQQTVSSQRQLNTLSNALSGTRLVRDAAVAAEALRRLGDGGGIAAGAAKLTSSELDRMGNTAQAAIAKLRVLGEDIPPEIQQLADATARVPEQLTLMQRASDAVTSSFTQMVGAFALGNLLTSAVSGLKEAASDTLDFAVNVSHLSDETGISTDRLQAFNYMAAGTGINLDDLTHAIDKMSKSVLDIRSDTDPAARALADLGLSVADIQKLSPDQMFLTIGDAISKVQDPARKIRDEMDLFGRTGAGLGRIFTENFAEVEANIEKTGPIIDHNLIEKADEFDRFWAQAWIKFRAYAAEGTASIFDQITGRAVNVGPGQQLLRSIQQATSGAPSLSGGGLSVLGVPDDATLQRIYDESDALKQTSQAAIDAGKAHDDFAAAAEKASLRLRELSGGLIYATQQVQDNHDEIDAMTSTVLDASTAVDTFGKAWLAVPADMSAAANDVPKVMGAFEQIAQGLPDLLERALTGGGGFKGFADALEAQVGKATTEKLFGTGGSLSGFAASATSKMSDLFGKTIGGALGAALPGIGSLLGPLIGKVGSFFSGLFNGGEGHQVNVERDNWIAQNFGTPDQFRQLAAAAGATDAQMRAFASSTKSTFESAATELSNLIKQHSDDQTADMDRLNQAVQKYGFTIEELGPQMRQQNLDKQAQDLIEDWRVLAQSGIAVSSVNSHMASTVQDYFNTALKVGAEIPDAMRPILQSMVDQGVLVDANGNKITDLGATGAKFSETMTEGFDKIVGKLQELIDHLNATGQSIQNIPKNVDINVGYNVQNFDPRKYLPAGYDPNNLPAGMENYAALGGLVTSSGIVQYLAGGGKVLPFVPRGTDTVPAMLTPGEMVLSRTQVAAMGGPSGVQAASSGIEARTSVLEKHLEGVRDDLADLTREIRSQRDIIPLAIKAAVQTAPRRIA